MKYGKIRIEDGCLMYTKHMMVNSLPCRDIVWVYMRREGADASGAGKQIIYHYLVIHTKRKKHYMFDMSEREARDCIRLLQMLNPDLAVGFPKGGRIPLQSLPNTRDLGALATLDGRHILPRRLLRSGELYHTSISDKMTLTDEYHLKTVVDFRTNPERNQKPDEPMKGVQYYHIPILDEDAKTETAVSGTTLPEQIHSLNGNGEEFMIRHYQNMITDEYSLNQFARFMDIVLHNENGAVLWHCSAGKDRTGLATVFLLCALGVSRKIIREDYLRSNYYLDGEMIHMMRLMEKETEKNIHFADDLSVLFKVKESYINVVFAAIDREYGSVNRFLRRALYLTPKALEELKEKYLF